MAQVTDETLHAPHLFDAEVLHALRVWRSVASSPIKGAGTP
jgi:hypothetical protein